MATAVVKWGWALHEHPKTQYPEWYNNPSGSDYNEFWDHLASELEIPFAISSGVMFSENSLIDPSGNVILIIIIILSK